MRSIHASHRGLAVLLVLTTWACGSPDDADGGTEVEPASEGCPASETYCADDQWLCRPGIEQDYCVEETTLTVIEEDGSETLETLEVAEDPAVDCFYVYPTVRLAFSADLSPDYSNLQDILTPLRAQAQPFSSVCRVFAPLYHQASLGAYSSANRDEFLDEAFEDVLAAFDTYVEHYSEGRDFVLLGHSQGADMLARLIARRVEQDEGLLSRMVVAIPIGSVGRITVPAGETVGGSFDNVPVCSTREQRGCFVTWDSGIAGDANGERAAAGMETPCVNPASFDYEPTRLSGSYFITRQHTTGITSGSSPDYPTTFVVMRDAYTGRCVAASNGQNLFEIEFSPRDGDTRTELIPLDSLPNLPGLPAMHLLDYAFATEDLLAVTQAKIDAP